jgi:predicted ATP-grasp superfamily ATP-dependent carboligase
MSTLPMNVLVTDGNERAALAITRSLGRRMRVVVGEERPGSLAAASRYCAREVVYPSPYTDPSAFERFLLRFIERERVDVLMAASDVTTHLVSKNASVIRPHAAIAVPPFDAFECVTDKWRLLQRAASLDIPIPATHFVDGKAALPSLLPRLDYPVVVKPTRSRIPTRDGWISGTAQYAADEHQLQRLYRDTGYLASAPSLIQTRIVGPGLGVFVLCDRGRVVASFAHMRLRERPPSGGVSVLCESAPLDAARRDQAIRLLEPLGWHGVAMLEYKRDLRTGQSVLMEVNGRFWGSLQLAIDAGVDFPYLATQLALERPLDVSEPYAVGVRSRWALGDVDHLLARFRRGRANLPDHAPSLLGAVADFVRATGPGVRGEMWRRDDAAPAYRELCQYLTNSSLSMRRRLRRPLARFSFAPLFRNGR